MGRLTISGLGKSFGGMEVLRDIALDVRDGEFVVLVGPSGCGKSTLLRLIAGLEEATEGEIRIGERVVNDVPPKDRDIAMVFQNYALYPHMSVRRNIAFALRAKGRPKEEIEAKVAEAARVLELDALLDRRPGELSGGQRQRVAIGRAMVRDPSIFLFDEPLSNLDAKLRHQMRAELKKLHRTLGTTIVYVTHDQLEAMTLADRIAVMRGGRIEQFGSPLELYSRPANLFVAGFIGSPAMNFLKAEVEASGTVARLADGAALPLPVTAPSGRRITIGIRPDDLSLVGPGAETGAARLSGRLAMVEPLGSESLLTVVCAGQEIVCKVPGIPALADDAPLSLGLAPQALHVFDSESTLRLS
ncbi:sn-glycerol-3-phosphate ABC transporter ATP-binding protein UgpC [Chelatococcus sp. SYSU_G07232]|uniref:Sn-glycerol-3-phosphate ABC transporter ATP-binding protein UgpC n=1 Tax=Chelatococcus albus TaxID=3047466 RepID=A0ABT7AKY7_9HYPH|nr:sn-glycerol-3-phosphate ABC transporter ATP-binding protein UgpC [Chelatococcus sp. SYSU_G07232]MDJ1160037.1 sn-glycerol-3-phosphate ABC transporter ATP-binding protein UgpC [Chelatococcus sp. SYSU_G07232]